MTAAASIPADQLAALADADTQKTAARMAQEVFAGVFRLSASGEAADGDGALAEAGARCLNWCRAGGDDDGRALRLALLLSGLDQWGLAYSQAFGLTAIPALTALIGSLRAGLDARGDALFQRYFAQIEAVESDAIDFKIDLRRGIHLALWHAMAACETAAQAEGVLEPLGSMMVALDARMPQLGWRLLADALTHIQIGLLNGDAPASAVAQEGTQRLFASLRHALPAERYRDILAYSGQAVVAWQRSRQAAH